MTEQPKTEEVKKMEAEIPASDSSIYGAFDDQSSTLPAVFGGLIGLQNKDIYAIIERTNLPNEEIRIIVDLMRLAEHGIGTPKLLDRPIPYIGKVVINYMRAKVSVTSKLGHGTSREEVIEALTSWTKTLEARDAQLKQQKQGAAG
jgi:hypothetical protein